MVGHMCSGNERLKLFTYTCTLRISDPCFLRRIWQCLLHVATSIFSSFVLKSWGNLPGLFVSIFYWFLSFSCFTLAQQFWLISPKTLVFVGCNKTGTSLLQVSEPFQNLVKWARAWKPHHKSTRSYIFCYRSLLMVVKELIVALWGSNFPQVGVVGWYWVDHHNDQLMWSRHGMNGMIGKDPSPRL